MTYYNQRLQAAQTSAYRWGAFVLLMVVAAIITLAVQYPTQLKWTAIPILAGLPLFKVAQRWVFGYGNLWESGDSWNFYAALAIVFVVEAVVVIVWGLP